jgi:hypothetical protein
LYFSGEALVSFQMASFLFPLHVSCTIGLFIYVWNDDAFVFMRMIHNWIRWRRYTVSKCPLWFNL